jgi:hypothetical protein
LCEDAVAALFFNLVVAAGTSLHSRIYAIFVLPPENEPHGVTIVCREKEILLRALARLAQERRRFSIEIHTVGTFFYCSRTYVGARVHVGKRREEQIMLYRLPSKLLNVYGKHRGT